MDRATARERLESMLAELDRSIGVLRGDPEYERSAADAGADLADADRNQAMLEEIGRAHV